MASAPVLPRIELEAHVMYDGDFNGLAHNPTGIVVMFWSDHLAKVLLDQPIFDPEKGETYDHVPMCIARLILVDV